MVDKTQIDPELLTALDDVLDIDFWNDLDRTRAERRRMAEDAGGGESVLENVPFHDYEIAANDADPTVRVRAYRPAGLEGPLPGLLWIHGGGYVMGSIDVEVPIMQHIVNAVGCVVVAVEYRLAPEHPYPAPLNDCYRALEWMFANASDLGTDNERIAIGGISAGGGLAAALALMARDKAEYPIIFQLLMCPMLDDRNELPSTHMDLTGIGWTRGHNLNGWRAYLAGEYDATLHDYAVPARIDDLSGLPPAYLSIGTLDIFLDEDIHYARRLIDAGVATELHTFPGAMHAFEYRVPGARVSRRAHYLNYEILKHALNGVLHDE